MPDPTTVAGWFRDYVLTGATEYGVQYAVTEILCKRQVAHQAEYRLGPKDRVDFWLPEYDIAIEVKVKGSWKDVTAQLLRYMQHTRVRGIVLVTTRRMHSTVPATLDGKPVAIAYVGEDL